MNYTQFSWKILTYFLLQILKLILLCYFLEKLFNLINFVFYRVEEVLNKLPKKHSLGRKLIPNQGAKYPKLPI